MTRALEPVADIESEAEAGTAELPPFPMPRVCPMDPPPGYATLAAERSVTKVVLPTGRTAWLVTGHGPVRQILNDPGLSVNRTDPGYPHLVAMTPQLMAMMAQVNSSLLGLDPPRHTVYRRLLINEFTVRRFASMRPRIQEIVDGCIDKMLAAGPPVDLHQLLSLPVPARVICELLGMPYQDHEIFEQSTQTMLNRKLSQPERAQAAGAIRGHVDRLVTVKENDPGDDMIGRLVVKYREAGLYDHQQMVGLAMLLLMAGHETTANTISLGVLALAQHPDQLDLLKRDPSVTPKAVEEILRFLSIVDASGGSRVAVEDIEIEGVTIRKGEGIIALLSGANRDGGFFPEPDALDISRGGRHHVGFGYGIHQCLGQNLARLELEVAFSTLYARIPGLRVAAPIESLSFKDDASVYGVVEVPVTW
ncbi:MAG TPA: cytochrome P450 [Mycobacteriales bacterium]|nr:cytochrome P450 [Mycobacteriales bacterium]